MNEDHPKITLEGVADLYLQTAPIILITTEILILIETVQ